MSVQSRSPFRIVRAAEWGVEWKRPPVAEPLADPETYIHHGAGGRFGNDSEQAMRDLQTWYHNVKDYSTIAYDIVVHKNRFTEEVTILGAREGWMTAATANRNDLGEAVCLMGYFHPGHHLSEQPSKEEIEALAWAVAWSVEMGWSAPDTKVLGHRDNPAHPGATACPGDYLYAHVPYIEGRAHEILNTPLEDDMSAPPRPYRVYDSREKGGSFSPGETRVIQVGKLSEVFVNVTAIGNDMTGYISVNDPGGLTAVVNYNRDDRLEGNSVPAKVTNGGIAITNTGGWAHVILDVFAEKS